MSEGTPTPTGLLVVFEGIDGSGKSTRAQRLTTSLREDGLSCELIAFPDRSTPIGVMLDQYLRGEIALDRHVAHLLFSANRWELAARIASLKEVGTHVILDRYHHSGTVYSMSKGLDRAWCQAPDKGLPVPDLIFYIQVKECDVEQLVRERLPQRIEIFENAAFLTEAIRLYDSLYRPIPEELFTKPRVITMNAFEELERGCLQCYNTFRRELHESHIRSPMDWDFAQRIAALGQVDVWNDDDFLRNGWEGTSSVSRRY